MKTKNGVYLLLFALVDCDNTEKTLHINGSTMGTKYHISLVKQKQSPKISQDRLKQQIDQLFQQINQQMSTYLADSEISKFNRYNQTNWFPVSKDFAHVVNTALKISKQTHGAFDISVAPFIDLWGFGAKTQYEIPSSQQIKQLFPQVGFQHIHVKNNPAALKKDNIKLHIDLSAIAKGFAVDKISVYLENKGWENYLVEIGGEVRAKGINAAKKKWKIAIEQPDLKQKKANHIISISNKAVATSGDYRNYYIKDGIRYSHTIDPKTGFPVKHKLASVTVLNDSTMLADAYATALMVMGEVKGKAFAQKNKLQVNMIIRDKKNKFSRWSNLPN